MSAPSFSGWIRYGVATVLSTISGTSCLCATSATAWISVTSSLRVANGLPAKTSRVFSVISASKSFRLILFHIFYGNPERLQIIEQFHSSAIQSAGCHDLVSRLKNVQKRIGQRRHSGCTGHTADPILQHGHCFSKDSTVGLLILV